MLESVTCGRVQRGEPSRRFGRFAEARILPGMARPCLRSRLRNLREGAASSRTPSRRFGGFAEARIPPKVAGACLRSRSGNLREGSASHVTTQRPLNPYIVPETDAAAAPTPPCAWV